MTPAPPLRIFQFDQCFNDHRVHQACNDEGVVRAYSFPNALKDWLDPEVLKNLLPRGNPIVTTDRRLPIDHAEFIPNHHPGILVVLSYEHRHRTMTTERAAKILAAFKSLVVSWHELPVQNAILMITEAYAELHYCRGGTIIQNGFFEFSSDDWVARLTNSLRAVAAGTPLAAPESESLPESTEPDDGESGPE